MEVVSAEHPVQLQYVSLLQPREELHRKAKHRLHTGPMLNPTFVVIAMPHVDATDLAARRPAVSRIANTVYSPVFVAVYKSCEENVISAVQSQDSLIAVPTERLLDPITSCEGGAISSRPLIRLQRPEAGRMTCGQSLVCL